MQASTSAIVARLRSLLADTLKKCGALQDLHQASRGMIDSKSTLEALGLNSSYLYTQAGGYLATSAQMGKLSALVKDYFIFNVGVLSGDQDLQLDIEEALLRIQARLDKADQIRANSISTKEKSDIKLVWEQHSYIVQQMGLEMKLFRTQTSESMRRLMQELEKVILKHHSAVTNRWKEEVSNKSVVGCEDCGREAADKSDFR